MIRNYIEKIEGATVHSAITIYLIVMDRLEPGLWSHPAAHMHMTITEISAQ